MASLPSQVDLDLARCFKGEQQLITWYGAYTALCEPETASNSRPLREFLGTVEALDMLSRPWKPFPPPSPQEKNKFETKTAPVSVTPSSNGHYNLDEIKEDSLWLSKEAQISEYAALRLVVQEWQSRPTVQLLSGLTEEEALSVHEAVGFSNLGASTFVPNSSILGNPSTPGQQTDAQFNSSDQRRLRIIDIYCSACVSILRISQMLMAWGSARDLRRTTPNLYCNDYRVSHDWLEQMGQAIAVKQNSQEATPSTAAGLDKCIRALRERLDAMNQDFTWNTPESIYDAASVRWLNGLTTELLHLLHIALFHADLTTSDFIPAPTIEEWFTTISGVGFFREFPTVTADQQPLIPLIQLLTSLVSVAVLKIHLVFDHVHSGKYSKWDSNVYLLDLGVNDRLTQTFDSAIQLGPSPATPPALAWAIILWQLNYVAEITRDDRDKTMDGQPGRTVSMPTPSALEDAILPLAQLTQEETHASKLLADACVDHGVLGLMAQLINIGMAGFGTVVDRVSRDRFRLVFLQVIRAALAGGCLDYHTELIVAAHTIMTGDRSFHNWTAKDSLPYGDPVVAFCLADKGILRSLLTDEANLRYPYELAPFLKFYSALIRGWKAGEDGIPILFAELTNKRTLMQRLPDGFKGYRPVNDDDDQNGVALSEQLSQFKKSSPSRFPTQQRLLGSVAQNEAQGYMVINVNTRGTVVDDTAVPFVVVWNYPHSALHYLVHLLSTFSVGSNKVETSTKEPASLESATEIIGFFADLMHSSLQGKKSRGDQGPCSPEVLEALEIHTGDNQDTTSLVLSIFEQELRHLCQEPSNEGSLELLINCTHFLQALVVIAPNRVWPWLARSKLLESDGNGGSLATILIGTEMVLGRYEFLIGCIRLFSSLIDDAVERSVARKSSSRALTRMNAATTSSSGTSDKIMSNTLLTFGRTLASIYEGSLGWRYNRIEDRLEINIGICEAFNSILHLAYSVDDAPQLSEKLTRLIAPTAAYITELYLTKSENDLPTNPILASLLSGADIIKSSLLTSSAALWKRQTQATLELSAVLVRVAMLIGKPWTHLEQQLFKATPLLARLYATSDLWKNPVLFLLESLVRGATRVDDEEPQEQDKSIKKMDAKEPPSLLGHLGTRTAKNFLSVLSLLDEPLRTVDIQRHVWDLLSAVVTCKQQWFALYLLTGTTPRENMRAKSKPSTEGSRNKALLSRALDALSKLDLESPNRPWPLFTAMLGFVTSAQNNWSWAMGNIRERKDFLEQLLAFLSWMAKQPRDPRDHVACETRAHQNKFTSLAAEILAMYLHSSRQIGDLTPLKNIVPNLFYLESNALRLPTFNESLHSNLRENLKKEFPGVLLSNLKRTTLLPPNLGQTFFYEVDSADKLLKSQPGWKGSVSGQGFRDEVIRANINLSLVESQVQLLESWKLLATELSHVVSRDERLVKVLIQVVKECMQANAKSTLPEALFGQLVSSRADLAYVLLKKLVEARVKVPEARQLIHTIWDAIRTSTPDFDTVFSSTQAYYYRSLLRILYLSLQFHLIEEPGHAGTAPSADESFRSSFRGGVSQSTKIPTESISNKLLEILSDTVAKGFRSLANQLHAEPDSVSPSDFALLTALLQRIIAIPEMSKWQTQAALLFANSNTIRYATSLFSWSDKLTTQNGSTGVSDPVYGELSLLFVLSLSSLPSLAETMAVEGILSQLNTANLMNYYRRPGGMGPFDSPHRLHSIWTKSILPLCLNLVLSVGAPIAGEISSFLNQFPEQLTRSSNALNSRYSNRVTLSVASETHSLALLANILDTFRAQGPRLGIQASEVPALDWDKENVKEDIEGWMARKGALRERVVIEPGQDREVIEEKVLAELMAAGVCLGLKTSNGA